MPTPTLIGGVQDIREIFMTDVLRDATQNYLNGQNTNKFPWSINNITEPGFDNNDTQTGGSGDGETSTSGADGEIIELSSEDSGSFEGSANNDYIFKAGVEYYDIESSLENMSKAIRDASKAELQAILYRFDTDPDLKSIIRDGANSYVFEGADVATAQRFAAAIKSTKELVESAIEYEPDFNGNNFLNFLKNVVENADNYYSEKTVGALDLILKGGETAYDFKIVAMMHPEDWKNPNDYYKALKTVLNSPPTSVTNFPELESKLLLKNAGNYLSIFSVGVEIARLVVSYAEYSETVDCYERIKQGIQSSMTEENMEESLKLIEDLNKIRGQEAAKVVSNLIGVVGAAIKIPVAGQSAKQGAVSGAKFGGGKGAVIGALGGGSSFRRRCR